jgi:hypothetical protein
MTLVALADAAAFDVSVFVLSDVVLEAGAEFPEVVPESRQVGPRSCSGRSGLRGSLGDLLQMIDEQMIGAVGNGLHTGDQVYESSGSSGEPQSGIATNG